MINIIQQLNYRYFFPMQVIRENCHLYTMMAHSVLLVLTTEAEPHGKLCQHFSIYLNM